MALKPTVREVLSRLQSQGALPADAGDKAAAALERWHREHGASPWYLRVFVGVGAWFAALFLGVAIGMLLILTPFAASPLSLIPLGAITIGAALALRHARSGDFSSQLALAKSLAGQGLLLLGVGGITGSLLIGAVVALIVSGVLLFSFPDPIHRFLSALGACCAALFLLHQVGSWPAVEVGAVALAAALHLVFHQEAQLRRDELARLVTPTGFALVLAVFGVLLARTSGGIDALGFATSSLAPTPLLTVGLALVSLVSAWRILDEHGIEATSTAGALALGTLVLCAALTLQTPGVIAAAGALALAFHRRNGLLLGMGVVFLLGFGVLYYYDLALSLLAKSGAMLGSGVLLLALRQLVLRRFTADPAQEVA